MWKKVLLGVVGFIVAVVLLVMYATSGMTDTAESFFDSVADNNYNRAYSYLSDDFIKATSKKQLIAFMKGNGFDKYVSASWGNRSMEGKRGVIEGTIETKTNGAIPVKVKFVKLSDGSWRIYSIEKPQSGLQIEPASTTKSKPQAAPATQKVKQPVKVKTEPKTTDNTPKSPDDAKTLALVKNTILHFTLSVNKKDMTYLRNDASERFKKAVTIKQANDGFKSFMDIGVDFTVLNKMTPIIDSKEIKDDGRLVVKGHYETGVKKFYYEIHYIQEGGLWKLIAMDAKIE